MSVVIPNSRIRLLKTPIEIDNNNQLTFSNLSSQTTYFLSLPYLEYDNCTYVRKDGVIRYATDPSSLTYEDLLKYNYCMYQNTAYDNKWFFAFITDIKYINDGTTDITIKTDVFQSWQFDLVYKNSFVEREHVNDDTIGLHTLPENLETGEYVNVETSVATTVGNDISICVATSKRLVRDGSSYTYNATNPEGKLVNGIYQGLQFAIFSDYPNYSGIKEKEKAVNMYIYFFEHTEGVSGDDIIDIFMIPTSILGNNYTETEWQFDSGSQKIKFKYLNDTSSSMTILENYLLKDNVNMAGSYVPKNNKLYCYPFRYLLASNGTGQDVVYKWELFTHDNQNYIKFRTIGALTPNGSIKCVPQNYKGLALNYEEAINFSKYPTCSWIFDAYTNWMTQNNVNNNIRTLGGAVKIATGVHQLVTGAAGMQEGMGANNVKMINSSKADIIEGGGQIGSGINAILNVAMEQYQHQFDANQARGNINSGDINFSYTKNDIVFYKKSIKPEYARIIDDILSRFGYQVNSVKTPNINGRLNWNYVKTININLIGDIPQKDLEEIKTIFNRGVTLWHNPSTFLDYSQSNTII